jgi:legumain
LFSIEWIEDSDSRTDLDQETVQQQFARVKKLTSNSSHVMEYGDVTIGRSPVGQFQGESRIRSGDATDGKRIPRPTPTDVVPSHDVPLIIAERKMMKATTESQKKIRTAVYQGLKSGRDYMGHAIQMLVDRMSQHLPKKQAADASKAPVDLMKERMRLTHHSCYQQLYSAFDSHCFDLSSHPFALRFLYVFVNVCESLDQQTQGARVNLISDLIADECHKNINQHPFKSIT